MKAHKGGNMKSPEILYEDFKKNIVDVINNCGLPPFIIGQVLESVLTQVRNLEKVNYEKALEAEKQAEKAEKK